MNSLTIVIISFFIFILGYRFYSKFISEMINKCKSVSEELDNLEFNEDQVYRRNEIDLNCERHKRIFNRFNISIIKRPSLKNMMVFLFCIYLYMNSYEVI